MKKILLLILVISLKFSFNELTNAQVLPSKLAEYSFNGDAIDQSGNGNDGLVNGAIFGVGKNGNSNSALIFDGIDDYVDIGSIGIGTEFSIRMIFKPENVTKSNHFLFISNGPSANTSFYFRPNGELLFNFWPQDNLISGENTIQDNIWYDVVITRSTEERSIYIDGILVASGPTNLQINDSDGWIIGGHEVYDKDYFQGTIDEVTIYDGPLNVDQVSSFYDTDRDVLYLKKDPVTNWTLEGEAGSQFKEIQIWKEYGYSVTESDLSETTISEELISKYEVIRINGSRGGEFIDSEGDVINTWTTNGGRLFAELPFQYQMPLVSRFGVNRIEGNGGGSNGLDWKFNGSPFEINDVEGFSDAIQSIAIESMDEPILTSGHDFTIEARINDNPALVSKIQGSGKVLIAFFSNWSHDITFSGNSYRANIDQADNEKLLREIIQYLSNDEFSTETEILNQRVNRITLNQNYPNPFNPSTNIEYNIPKSDHVTLKVYDITGREVATLIDGMQNIGTHSINFDASNLASGVYIYRLTSGSYLETKRMMLIK